LVLAARVHPLVNALPHGVRLAVVVVVVGVGEEAGVVFLKLVKLLVLVVALLLVTAVILPGRLPAAAAYGGARGRGGGGAVGEVRRSAGRPNIGASGDDGSRRLWRRDNSDGALEDGSLVSTGRRGRRGGGGAAGASCLRRRGRAWPAGGGRRLVQIGALLFA
jgi:hypothetical protein